MKARFAVLIAAALTLDGCASFSGIEPLAHLFQPPAAEPAAAPLSAAHFPAQDWWRAFGDARLDALIDAALAHSPDLGVALARVRAAQAAAAAADANRKPRVDFSASDTRQRFSENDIYPPPFGGAVDDMASTRATASWSPDFFGAQRDALDAAIGAANAAQADVQAARVGLAADVARAYFNLARLQNQRRLDQTLLQQREKTFDLVRLRVGAGLETTLAERQAQAEAPALRADIAALDAQIAQQRHALAALTGAPPDATAALDAHLPQRAPGAPPAVIPAELLGHRADVVAARWRVEAAGAVVRGAKTAFYPNINLSAFIGFDAIGLSHWISSGSRVYGVTPAVSLPLFDAGRLRAQLRQQTASLDVAIEQYNARVFGALSAVADALSAWRSIDARIAQQRRVDEALAAATALAQQRYDAGLDNFLTVLVAQGNALRERRSLVDLEAQAYSSEVALIAALGGGYDPGGAPAPASTATGAPHE